MARFLLQRTLGDVSREDLDRIAARSQEIRDARYPDITWEHTHVVRTGDGDATAFCVYSASDGERVKAHAAELGVPLERFEEVWTDLRP